MINIALVSLLQSRLSFDILSCTSSLTLTLPSTQCYMRIQFGLMTKDFDRFRATRVQNGCPHSGARHTPVSTARSLQAWYPP
jgi:hypothetical protein